MSVGEGIDQSGHPLGAAVDKWSIACDWPRSASAGVTDAGAPRAAEGTKVEGLKSSVAAAVTPLGLRLESEV